MFTPRLVFVGKGSTFQCKRPQMANSKPNDTHSSGLVTMCLFVCFQLNAEVLVAATSLLTNGLERERLGLGLRSSYHHRDQSSLGRSRDGHCPGVWRGWSWSGSPCRQHPPCLAHFLLPQPWGGGPKGSEVNPQTETFPQPSVAV